MISFGVARLGRSADSRTAGGGGGGSRAATCTGFGFAASLASFSAIGSGLLGLRSIAGCALAILTGAAGFVRAGLAAEATVALAMVAVVAGIASSSSSSWVRANSLAKG